MDPWLARNAVFARVAVERLWTPGSPIVPPVPASLASLARKRAIDVSTMDVRGYIGLFGQSVLVVRGFREAADAALPAYERFLSGGGDVLRGFRVGYAAGDTLTAGSLELRTPITSPLRFARLGVSVFADAAAVYDVGSRLREQRFDRGIGAGVSQILAGLIPAGPFSSLYVAQTIGASGAIYGILLAYALSFPNRPILIYFIFPVPAKILVAIMGGISLISAMEGGGGVAHVAHLGGLVVGYVYLKTGGANPLAIETARDAIIGFLSTAPAELRTWSARQVALTDEAYALLADPTLDPASLDAAAVAAEAVTAPVRHGIPTAPVATRRRGLAGLGPVGKAVASAIGVAAIVGVVYGVYQMGQPAVPGISGSAAPESSAAASSAVDTQQVASLMQAITANPTDGTRTVATQTGGPVNRSGPSD